MFQKIITISSKQTMKKAFTLIELLIVVAIISMIGIFTFSKMVAIQKAKISNNVEKIKDVFKESDGDVELLCLENSTQCFIISSGAKVLRELSNPIGEMQAFVLDDNDNPQRLELGRYRNKQITLRMKHYKNGSTTQLIIKNKENFYLIPSYFGEVKKFDAIDDAVSLWLKNTELVEEGGYYR